MSAFDREELKKAMRVAFDLGGIDALNAVWIERHGTFEEHADVLYELYDYGEAIMRGNRSDGEAGDS